MYEKEWETTENTTAMLRRLGVAAKEGERPAADRLVSERKVRLFLVASCRLVWADLCRPYREVVETAERYADGDATDNELADAIKLTSPHPPCNTIVHWAAPNPSTPNTLEMCLDRHRRNTAEKWFRRAAVLRDTVGNPFRPATPPKRRCPLCEGKGRVSSDDGWNALDRCKACGGKGTLDCPTVTSLARAAYEERNEDGSLDPARLAVLADALEETGLLAEAPCGYCEGEGWVWDEAWPGDDTTKTCPRCKGARRLPHPLLAHLRSPRPLWRGAWSLDLCLGLE